MVSTALQEQYQKTTSTVELSIEKTAQQTMFMTSEAKTQSHSLPKKAKSTTSGKCRSVILFLLHIAYGVIFPEMDV